MGSHNIWTERKTTAYPPSPSEVSKWFRLDNHAVNQSLAIQLRSDKHIQANLSVTSSVGRPKIIFFLSICRCKYWSDKEPDAHLAKAHLVAKVAL